MSAYPEHDRLLALKVEKDTVGAFLDWLADNGYHLAKYVTYHQRRDPVLEFMCIRPDQIIGAFLDISPEKLEAEKRAMLASLRADHEARP